MKDFYLILFHISIVFSVITASNSFEVLGAVTGTETTIHSSAVLPPPPPAAPTVSLGVSPTGTVCAATALNFTATGSPTTGTNTYEFLVNGSVVQGPGISNTYSSSSLTNGQQVTTRLTNKPTFDGVINEALWDTPLSTSAGGAAPGFGAGHEVNALYSFGTANDFYLAVAGNVQNGNRILVFIDSKSGGYADGNFGRSGAPQGVDDFNSSTTFDSGFLPDYCLTMGTNGSNYFWDLYTLSGTAGSGGGPNTYLGDNSAAAVGGVDLKASPLNSSQTRGFEAGLPKSLIGYTGGTIKVMVMYASDAGFLSNQFLTPAGSGEGNYGSGAVTFGAAAPGPIVVSSTALSTVNTATSTPIIASVSLLPTITVSSNSPTCEGSTLSLLATGGSTYSWAGPNGFTSAVQNPSIISVTPAATGTYTVTVTNSAGCSTVGTTAVTINATPTADAGLPQTVCQGGTITLGGSLGGSATTSTWSASSGAFSDATSLTSTYTPSITSGTVTLTLTTNDPDGAGPCSAAVSTVVITVGQAPVVNAGAPQSVCAGQSITLNGSTTGVPATPVTWSAPSGTFSNVNLLTSTYTPSITSGTVTLTLTTSDPDGAGPCVAATSTVLITVMASPTVTAGSNTPVCGGNPLSLTSSGGILYSWSGPSGFSSTSQNPSISAVTAANAGDYTVTVTNSNACSATGSTTVVINGAFSASASSNSPVNQGNTINLSTPTSGSSYAWSGPNAFTSSAQNPTVTATPEASGVYTVVVTNASGCTAMATTLVTVNLSQTTVTICSGTDVTLTATISGGSGTCGITWETSPNGTTGWTVIPGQTGTTYTTPALNNFTLLQTAVYYRATYTCTGTGCGSSISNTQQILINPEPVGTPLTPVACSDVAVGVGATLAVPLATTYNITSIVDNGLTASAGSPATGNGLAADVLADDAWTNTTGSPVNVIYTIVPVSGASPNNCEGNPFTVTVTVNPEPVGVATPATQTVCSDTPITTIVLTTSNSLNASTTYAWTRDNTSGITVLDPSGTGNISGTPNNVTGTVQTTVYTITPTTGIGCVGNTFTASVTVNPEPVGTPLTPAAICSEVVTGVTLTVPLAATYNITSIVDNGLTASAGNPAIGNGLAADVLADDAWTNTTGSPVNVIYTIVPVSGASPNNCEGNPFTVTVTVNPEPVGVATPATQTVCSDTPITTIVLTTSNSLNASTTYAWTRDNTSGITVLDPSGTGNISGTPNNVTGTVQTTVYTITPTTGIGCVGNTFTASVTVNPEPVGTPLTPAAICSEVVTGVTLTVPLAATYNITSIVDNGLTASAGNPAIGNGLAADVLADDAWTNTTGSPVNVIYTIVPVSGASPNNCEGNPFTVTVTVNPEPVGVATPATQTVCSDTPITTIVLTTSNSLNASTTYAWTRDNTSGITVLDPSGTGNISGTPNNVTGTVQTTVYTITPTTGIGCVGNTFTASVTVNPEPVGTPLTPVACSDVAVGVGATLAVPLATTYNITSIVDNGLTASAGSPATGNGLAADVLADDAWTNTTGSPVNVIYTIVPVSGASPNNCEGNPFTVTVTVNPEPVGVATPATQTVCSDTPITTIVLTTSNSLNASTTYAWTRDNTSGITVLDPSGTGNISGTPNNVTGTVQTTVYTITPTTGIGCVGNTFTASVTVNPEPVGTPLTPAAICSEVVTGVTLTVPLAATYNITSIVDNGLTASAGNPAIGNGLAADVLADDAWTNTTGSPVNVIYTIVPVSGASPNNCEGNPFTVTVTVNPEPVGVATPATQTVCSDTPITTIVLTTSNSLNASTTYAWTRDNTSGITVLDPSGTGNISGTPNNVTGTVQTTVYTITPTTGIGCVGNTFTASVTVNPEPVGTPLTPAAICSEVVTGVTLTVPLAATYNITSIVDNGLTASAGNPAIGNGLAADVLADDAWTNTTGSPVNVIYTIVPVSGASPNNCEGNPFTVTVTVNPEPVGVATPATQTVCSDTPITTIVLTTSNSLNASTTYAWTRDNTSGITVLDPSGTGNISGTPNNVTGTVQTTVYTITPTTGIGCVGNTFTASVTVNPEPVGTPLTPAAICSEVVTGVTLTVPLAATYNITSIVDNGLTASAGNPAIGNGLAADVLADDAWTNTTGSPVNVIYTIVPVSGASPNNCEGNPFTVTVTVNPEPVGVATPATQTVCSDTPITTIVLTTSNSLNASTTYAWTRDNTSGITVLDPSGTGNISGTPNNVTGTVQTTVYTITPTTGIGCVGNTFTASVTVNPEPVGTPLTPAAICSEVVTGVTLTVPLAATYNITSIVDNGLTASAGNPAIGNGLAADVLADDAWTNTTGSPVNVIYTIVPVSGASPNNCEGNPFTVTVTVNPEPVGVATPATQTVCSDTPITTIVLTTSNSLNASTTYAWTRDNTSGITVLDPSGTGNISGTPNNVTGTVQTTVYTITPTTGIGCVGNTFTASVTVNPEPVGTPLTPAAICSEVVTGVTLTVPLAATYNITSIVDNGLTASAGNPAIGDGLAADVLADDAWTNTTGSPVNVIYTIVPVSGASPNNCEGNPFTVTVTVNPEPVGVATPATQTVCSDTPITTIVLTTSNSLNASTTYAWTRDNTSGITVLDPSGTGNISGTPNNVTGTVQTTVYTITPTTGIGCVGNTFTASVTVNPEPVGTPLTPAAICSEVVTGVTLTVPLAATYNITSIVDNGLTASAGSPATGNGLAADVLADDAWTNTTGSPVNVIYTIVPVSGASPNNCEGNPFTVTVTVNPEPVGVATPATQTVCSDTPITTIVLTTSNSLNASTTYAWTRDNTSGITVLDPSGTGNISGTPNNVTGTVQTTVYTITPTTGIGCVGNTFTASVTVNPEPVGTPLTPAAICSEVVTGVTLTVPLAATYNITSIVDNGLTASAGNPAIGNGLAADVLADDAWTNTTGSPVNVIYTIVPVSGASPNNCEGNPFTVTVTVNPEPVGVATPATQTVCSDTPITTIVLTTSNSLNASTTYAWTRDNTSGITVLDPSGTGNISGTPNNVTGTVQTTVYTITPTTGIGCVGNTFTASVTVNPEPVGTPLTPAAICSEVVTGVTLTVPLAATYNITSIVDNGLTASAGNPAIGNGLAADVLADDAWTNTTGSPVNVIYTIVPVSGASPNNCEGNPFTVTVTVNPEPVGVATPATQTVCSDTPITTIVLTTSNSLNASTTYAWTRDNTSGITVLDPSGTGNISGTPNNVTGTVQTTVYTITPTTGIGCVGNTFTASVTVNPEPVGTPLTPAAICSEVVTGVTLTVPLAATYNITSIVDNGLTASAGNPAIGDGLAADVLADDAWTNTTGSPVNVIYTIVPVSGASPNNCEGNPFTVTVTVNPEPVGVATPATQTVCSDTPITTIVLTTSNSLNASTTYAWTRDNTSGITVLDPSGTGNISGTPNNVTGTVQTTVYTITPTTGIGCVGNTFTASVTVNPEPVGTPLTPAAICSEVVTGVTLTVPLAATYNITSIVDNGLTASAGNPAIGDGLAADVLADDAWTNTTGSPVNVIYTIVPVSGASPNNCEGNPFTVTVTVNPEPVGSNPNPPVVICSGTALNVGLQSTISNLPTGVTFSWSATDNADVTGETTTTSTASSITDILVNISGTLQTVIYTVTPTSAAPNSCVGNPYTITVTVNPAPIFNVIANAAYCNNDAATAINFNTNVSGATITWTSTVNVGFGTSGNGNIPAYTATNTGTTPVTTTVTVTATGVGSCVTTTTFTVTVNPTPAVNTVSTPETCNELNNGTASITPIVGTAPFNYQWSNGDVTANITALSAGTYTATVTDANGCSTITSTSVTQPDVLTATASGVNETCNQLNNASVSVVAAGGTTAYSYAWNSGQTTASVSNATAGTYTVTVTDANGCTVSTSTVVTQPDVLTATLESTVNVSCSTITPDGAINIATTGGTTAYTYAWTGSAATTEDLTGLAAGNYTLTVTDANGCSTVVGPITITLNPDPTITVGNSTTICTGGVANFTANVANGVGTCGVQWEQLIGATWTPISGANATTYTTVPLTATTDYRAVYSCSTGCTVTSSPVTATVTADPAISIASDATVCTGGTSVLTATPSGGTDSCIIQWQSSIDNSNWTNIPGANAATYTTPTLTTTTYYRALYTCNGNGCDGATSGSVTITVTATPVIIINAVPNGN
jgi:hypothetical protein